MVHRAELQGLTSKTSVQNIDMTDVHIHKHHSDLKVLDFYCVHIRDCSWMPNDSYWETLWEWTAFVLKFSNHNNLILFLIILDFRCLLS